MSKLARERGRLFEIEIGKILSQHSGQEIKRKLGQARDSGNDIDYGPFVVECKRTRALGYVSKWYQQAVDAVTLRKGEPGLIPVVIAREDLGQPVVILGMDDFLRLADTYTRVERDVLA